MRGFRFDNFRVLPENEAAVDRCRRVAALEEGAAAPLLLLGGPGRGKSHLLWAIVNQVRQSQKPAALVLVTPKEFPERVKLLGVNPEPVQRSRHGLLLVDGLEKFREDAPALEAVVKTFLDNHFLVAMSSSQMPIQLEAFSAGFKRQLTAADSVHLGGLEPQGKLAMSPSIIERLDAAKVQRLNTELEEWKAEAQRLRSSERDIEAERQRLTRELREANARADEWRERATKQEETERLGRQMESRLAEVQENALHLGETLQQARRERDDAQELVRELERRIQDLSSLADELDTARAALAEAEPAMQQLRAEVDTLRTKAERSDAKVRALEQGLVAAGREQARLQGLVDAQAGTEDALREAAEARERAIEESRAVAEQAAAVLDHLIAVRPDASDTTGEAFPMILEFLERLRERQSTGDMDLTDRLSALAGGEESAAQRMLREKLAEAASENTLRAELYEDARAEQGRLDVELGLLRGRMQETKYELERTRRLNAMIAGELDGVRQTAAAEAARHSMLLADVSRGLRGLAEWCAPGSGAPDLAALHDMLCALLAVTDGKQSATARDSESPAAQLQPHLFEEAVKSRALLEELSGPAQPEAAPADESDEFAHTIDRILAGDDA